MRILSIFVLAVFLASCKSEQSKTERIYFGFDKHVETPQDVLKLAMQWGERPICPQWRATLKREDADYQVLFGAADLTLIDRGGQVLYSGSKATLYAPNGKPDGSGVNLCKLTGE
jgi:hypothetical protein